MSPRALLWTALVAGALTGSGSVAAASTDGPRSPGGAALWSIGATVVPIAGGALAGAADEEVLGAMLMLGGLVVGPAAGYWYGDREARGWQGVALRGLVIGVSIAATAGADELADLGPILTGVTVTSGLALWDIALVARHVSVRNREAGYGAALTPYLDASGASGVAVTVRF